MEYKINEERKEYLKARRYNILLACPGSGKTTSVAYKLKTITNEINNIYGKGIGVLCLSFTNTASNQILSTYRIIHGESLKYPHLVSTIIAVR